MSGYEEQKVVEGGLQFEAGVWLETLLSDQGQKIVQVGLQFEGLEMEFFRNLLESALISPFGAECCHLEDFAE
jgi:hypothetical protein